MTVSRKSAEQKSSPSKDHKRLETEQRLQAIHIDIDNR
jgi:hypothetical protein